MKIEVITLFPGIFKGFLEESIIKQAQKKAVVSINLVDLRGFGEGRHLTCDDSPYGGGAGMVMKCEPLFKAVRKVSRRNSKVILMSPQGQDLNQTVAKRLAKQQHLVIICGRYEGIDERARARLVDEEISIGDFVVSGGEVPAMVLIEAVVRLVPGAISKQESYEKDSFYQGLLDWPHYTRPAVYKKMKVPPVLISGNHAAIAQWRREQAEQTTKKNRPDLWADYLKSTKKK
ncbi:MAG: tRNA (guanosine(37)-N1)-methyltransferase TrmD [bacterium]|nr:tRNA (guanosine(37)-N1)-methyltransferase TrmD [bacterium]MDD5353970.1 tRNA (guanosine(37)-N1)-methyltransferase TrmD [bacterium]MDD5756057.1 tRNA (guanosine(37)-N1)-methyltransferase TrmD [bacterium]